MSSPADPLVSVILPVKNGERFIEEALASVLGQVAAARLEVIVIDDRSTDNTVAAVARACSNVVILSTPSVGPSAARNAGIARARGKYIGFIDHDDLWPDGKLAAQVGYLERDPTLDISISRTRWEWLPGRDKVPMRFAFEDDSLHFVNLGACLMRRHVFDHIGLFAEDLRYGEDHDILLRAREAGLVIRVAADSGLIYRQHSANMTRARTLTELNTFEILRRSLRRRTKSGRLFSMPKMTEDRE